jgi:hypothetical protein
METTHWEGIPLRVQIIFPGEGYYDTHFFIR